MPSLGQSVYVTNGAFTGSIRALMIEAGCYPAKTYEDADVVVFSGGGDINPSLYNEKPAGTYGWSDDRDAEEVKIYHHCVERNKFMFGICRGAQFLHAMNGGRLWQDVSGHGNEHSIVDLETGHVVMATSIHHQMLRNNNRLVVVACTTRQISTRFKAQGEEILLSGDHTELEIEAGYYPETPCFFVQGHPEIGTPEYRSWTLSKLEAVMTDWYAVNPRERKVA